MSTYVRRILEVAQQNANNLAANPQEDNSPEAAEFKWIGLAIVIGSAILSNLGVNVQKLSHVKEERRPIFQQRPYYVRPLWTIGMALVILGSVGDFEALAFAPQALVASVGGGCTVLANMGFAHLWLGQRLGWSDILGTLFIVVGVVLSTLANKPDAQLDLDELEGQFRHLGFVIYFSVMCVVLLGIFGEIRAINRYSKRTHEHLFRRQPYLYATASGIFGSFSVLLAKCASMLLLLTFQGDNQFVYPLTYLFVGGMVATLILQTDLLNRAIMSGDTLSVFPVFQCFWIGSSVVGGVVFYQKYDTLTLFEWISLPIALVLIIVGIYLLTQRTDDELASALASGRFGSLMPLSPTPTTTPQHTPVFGSALRGEPTYGSVK
ncbi:NIPA-like protein 3 [Aphanomyces cochlioides]|nr:NIPA-like protein 3 [Aphanomyces cochlioides]